ncbi:TRAP transporter small permease subunit [Mesorhizobium sp. ESP7-2]|uniref:TRAP transporter small permease n=1 Tax=unclassified Mesorhizobium TaxID=325217 RepID=UPI001CCD1761|nr:MULTISPECIES: TRAP transporter small permease subunit [unclassified Mesorhizobium]MBZ9672803.1 TRAP transporter small permease subunit [Mesorhizobium sp. ES1-3]MBZ9706301.1 TRAP transporter small permease subunit [Mesorhizobium sp. ESP7-2]
MSATIRWLQARADNVAVALLAAMFIAFILQIFTRYVINDPLGWTLEVCLTTWLWLVFWSSAFVLTERDHVTFDLFYLIASRRMQRVFALISAAAIVAGFLAALPATYEYIAFYKIKKSATLRIRLDVVFSVYGLFAVAVIVRYALRIWQLARGGAPEPHDEATPL